MEEGVSSGQQEPCLFSSAPLDFKSAPAELTASSRFAWGDWWILFHWENSLFLLFFPFIIVIISVFVCLNHPLYCSAVLSPQEDWFHGRASSLLPALIGGAVLWHQAAGSSSSGGGDAEFSTRRERTATDRTELISSMSCFGLTEIGVKSIPGCLPWKHREPGWTPQTSLYAPLCPCWGS